MTAMDHYYENGPLPTWIGWYVQHWGHTFHAATALATLVIELGVCWLGFLPRKYRLACFWVVTPLQIGIIATANYAFLNYVVLALGVLLLDDMWIDAMVRFFDRVPTRDPDPSTPTPTATPVPIPTPIPTGRLLLSAIPLTLVLYSTFVAFLFRGAPAEFQWLLWPARATEPLRIANRYGLFAVMTRARYEIELQGSRDGRSWQPYPFRYKPQDLDEAPGVYAPYQPRFEWNLWFASLGSWRNYPFVVRAEARLLEGSPSVLSLFARDPFDGTPPRFVRAVTSQYHFTDSETQRTTGAWWTREAPALYCPEVMRTPDGAIQMIGGEPESTDDEDPEP
jgi:hypothetical protein